MPKIIELTVELEVQRVSCPGVWLCQDGRVSLTVFALGTSYQTCLLPPVFPMMFKDVFYFRKRFQETCALNNICCLLKEETIYCELVQWSENCMSGECTILAQYLGALNDVLFPPNMCSNDGVDLLMRRSKEFPVRHSFLLMNSSQVNGPPFGKWLPLPCSLAKPTVLQYPIKLYKKYRIEYTLLHNIKIQNKKYSYKKPYAVLSLKAISSRQPWDGLDKFVKHGILSPKIEIATKVRIDEVWNHPLSKGSLKKVSCHCTQPDMDGTRQKPVCHSAKYHRSKCNSVRKLPSMSKPRSRSRSTSRSRSGGSRSCCSLTPHDLQLEASCKCPKHRDEPPKHTHRPVHLPCPSMNPISKSNITVCSPRPISGCKRKSHYCVYNVETDGNVTWTADNKIGSSEDSECEDFEQRTLDENDQIYMPSPTASCLQKVLLESNYIEHESPKCKTKDKPKKVFKTKTTPCICEICKRYYELFHSDLNCRS